jgi:murein DD-endopeptidase MepM/ murein hydrolase activator NlpD
MPKARPMRALVLAVSSLVLSSILILGIGPAALAIPSEPELGEAVALVQPGGSEPFSPLERAEIVTYRIKSGDTLWDIAAAYDIDVDTIRWSNPDVARNPDSVALGAELVILPVKGAYVTVQAGDTVTRLAERWGVAPGDIANYPANNLRAGEEPRSGTKLVIPHGRLEANLAPPGSPSAGFAYAWPIRGTVTQGFGSGHPAVDFGAPYGAKVYAARAGQVVLRQWSPEGYGFLVIVDQGDGSRAHYSHLKGAWANVGDWLPCGGLVGEVGSTGNSTGPHVHFEIRIGGVPQNPLGLLPPKA